MNFSIDIDQEEDLNGIYGIPPTCMNLTKTKNPVIQNLNPFQGLDLEKGPSPEFEKQFLKIMNPTEYKKKYGRKDM